MIGYDSQGKDMLPILHLSKGFHCLVVLASVTSPSPSCRLSGILDLLTPWEIMHNVSLLEFLVSGHLVFKFSLFHYALVWQFYSYSVLCASTKTKYTRQLLWDTSESRILLHYQSTKQSGGKDLGWKEQCKLKMYWHFEQFAEVISYIQHSSLKILVGTWTLLWVCAKERVSAHVPAQIPTKAITFFLPMLPFWFQVDKLLRGQLTWRSVYVQHFESFLDEGSCKIETLSHWKSCQGAEWSTFKTLPLVA